MKELKEPEEFDCELTEEQLDNIVGGAPCEHRGKPNWAGDSDATKTHGKRCTEPEW